MDLTMIEQHTQLFRKEISPIPIFLSFAFNVGQNVSANTILSENEMLRYNELKNEKAKNDYISGRAAAKYALNGLFEKNDPFDYEIKNGIFGEPLVNNAEISISHSNGFAVAVASRERLHFGVDTELITNRYTKSINSIMTENEKKMAIDGFSHLCFWTAKEAISKVFNTGLASNFNIYEMNTIKITEYGYSSLFINFPQYIAHTFRNGNYLTTIVVPTKIEIELPFDKELKGKIWKIYTE